MSARPSRPYQFLLIWSVFHLLLVSPMGSAQQTSPAASTTGQTTEALSDARINRDIQSLRRQIYETDDIFEKRDLCLQILNLDPNDQPAGACYEKYHAEITQQLKTQEQNQATAEVIQSAKAALASTDSGKHAEALARLEDRLKTVPGDKQLVDLKQKLEERIAKNKALDEARLAKAEADIALLENDSEKISKARPRVEKALEAKFDDQGLQNELQILKTDLDNKVRAQQRRRVLLIVLAVIAVVTVIGALLFLLLRKRKGILEFTDGERAGEIFALEKPNIKIGALPEENDLVLVDAKGKVSRHHCEIFKEGRRYFVTDTSTNGTWLNGQHLEPGRPKVLRKGDRLSLAGQLTIIFRFK